MDGQLKKGAKSLPVVYSAPIVATNSDGDDQPVSDDRPSGRFLGRFSRYWRVFHASMIDGMPPLERPIIEPVAWTVSAGVQKILDNCGVEIIEKGDKAFYSRRTKAVTVPERSSFLGESDIIKAANFCAVSLHEVFHALEDRLGLVKPSKFGDEEYSKGELRVEIAAAMPHKIIGERVGENVHKTIDATIPDETIQRAILELADRLEKLERQMIYPVAGTYLGVRDVPPRQFCNKLLQNCGIGIRLGKGLHISEITGGKASHLGEIPPQVDCQASYDPGSPSILLLPQENVMPYVPI
jgi:hypothetical protein